MEQIIGTGSAMPEQVVDNHMLTNFMETSDEWIRERTGIISRHVASKETVSELAARAAKRAVENAGIAPEEIGLIIVATSTAEKLYPCVACEIQKHVGAVNAGCFDLNAACSGFLSAYQMAIGQLRMGSVKAALLVGAEVLSHVTKGDDRGTAILFGDGAGAIVLANVEDSEERSSLIREKTAFIMGADGSRSKALTCTSGVKKTDGTSLYEMVNQKRNLQAAKQVKQHANDEQKSDELNLMDGFIEMDGRGIYQFAVKQVPETIRGLLKMSQQSADEIDLYLLHQANQRIIESIARHLKQPMEKFPVILNDHGNMSAACIPVLLDELNRSKKLKRGMKLAMAGFGAGLTWAGATLIW